MIGRIRNAAILGDEELLEIHALVQQGLRRMQERNSIFPVLRSVQVLSQIAKEIEADMSMSGHELRTFQVADAESAQSDDLPRGRELTIREAVPLLPCGERHIRRLIRAGAIPILRDKPIMLDRDTVLAYAASHPKKGAA
jgi:hypothetical protein